MQIKENTSLETHHHTEVKVRIDFKNLTHVCVLSNHFCFEILLLLSIVNINVGSVNFASNMFIWVTKKEIPGSTGSMAFLGNAVLNLQPSLTALHEIVTRFNL